MDNELKSGDVVTLKSGGPLMVVEEFVEPDSLRCIWYSAEYEMYAKEIFVAASLVRDPDYREQQE